MKIITEIRPPIKDKDKLASISITFTLSNKSSSIRTSVFVLVAFIASTTKLSGYQKELPYRIWSLVASYNWPIFALPERTGILYLLSNLSLASIACKDEAEIMNYFIYRVHKSKVPKYFKAALILSQFTTLLLSKKHCIKGTWIYRLSICMVNITGKILPCLESHT